MTEELVVLALVTPGTTVCTPFFLLKEVLGVCSGLTTRRFVGHTKDVLSVAFSADNRQIVSGSRDHTIKLWNTLGVCKYTIQVRRGCGHGRDFNLVGVALCRMTVTLIGSVVCGFLQTPRIPSSSHVGGTSSSR